MTHVGLIGAGGISRAHVPGWLDHATAITIFSLAGATELAAEVQALAERRRSSGARGSDRVTVTVVDDLDQLLAGVDVVDVCTPTDTHADLTRAALEAGRHVLCEKPLTRYPEEAEELDQLAHERGLVLYPAHVVRFFPAYANAHAAVLDGLIGDLAVARWRRMGSYPDWSQWFGDEQRSGGLVMDLLIHDLDQALWTGGEVTSVYATLSSHRATGSLPVEMVDATLTHASGALSQVQAVWGPPGMEFRTDFHLTGTEGQLTYASADDVPVATNGGSQGRAIVPATAGRSPYTAEIEDFLACVADPTHTAVVTAGDGVRAMRLAQAVSMSITSGQPVILCADGAGCREVRPTAGTEEARS